ncbi:Putative pectinesterase/pectinesterase inhibitor 22 [Dionaea muscipula]
MRTCCSVLKSREPMALLLLKLGMFQLLLLLPSLEAQALVDQEPYQGIQAMITQACVGVEDEISCLSNVQSRLSGYDHELNATSVLLATIEATLNEAQQAMEMVTRFTSLDSSTSSSREQIAIEDCKELLDFTVTELAWSLAEMRPALRSSHNRHDHHDQLEGNLKAWLSAALSNQDTCLEGFEGTNRHVENFIKGGLKQVTQLVSNILTLYTRSQVNINETSRKADHHTNIDPAAAGFPEWMTEGDKELLVASPEGIHVDAVVAVDGTGKYESISQAIYEAPSYSNRRYVIYVKKGVYEENIDMKKKKTNIVLVGDGIGHTVISGNRNFMQGWTTFRTPTVAVSGKGFIARGITFRNTAGPSNHQAVALRVDSDQSAFYRCSMEGYQDTLYAHSLRQFYRECDIHGTIDFLFGNGAAVLQSCNIYTRVPLPLQKVTIAAQGRKSPSQSTGFIVQDSFVYASQPTYLGRPWKQYSRVVYMNTYMSPMVQPRGWLEWYGDFALRTLYFGEYRNYGPGASLAGRVPWPGYHVIRNPSAAVFFTVARFIDGRSWLPATGVKFSSGLSN